MTLATADVGSGVGGTGAALAAGATDALATGSGAADGDGPAVGELGGAGGGGAAGGGALAQATNIQAAAGAHSKRTVIDDLPI